MVQTTTSILVVNMLGPVVHKSGPPDLNQQALEVLAKLILAFIGGFTISFFSYKI